MKKWLVIISSMGILGGPAGVDAQVFNAPLDESLLLLSPMAMTSTDSRFPRQATSEKGAASPGPQKAVKACRLLSAGAVGGEWKKYRIAVGRKVIGGADSIDDLATVSAGFERLRVCEFRATAKCRLVEEGDVGGEWHRVRIELNGHVIAGADHFSELAPRLEQIVESRFCRLTRQDCELAGEGPVGGSWQKHRLTLDGAALFGGQDLGAMLEQSAVLRDLGICP